MSIKSKLIISYVFLITFSITVVSFMISKESQDAIFKEVSEKSDTIVSLLETTLGVRDNLLNQKLSSDLHLTQKLIENYGDINLKQDETTLVNNENLPSLYAGNKKLSSDNSTIDYISNITGSMTSLFILHNGEFIRVSSNFENTKDTLVGSTLKNSSLITEKLLKKEKYLGRSRINDKWYSICYAPLLDSNNNVIGAFALGYRELDSYLEEAINSINVGKTGYVYILDSTGKILVHPFLKDKTLYSEPFIQEILNNKNGQLTYTFEDVKKVSSYKYFKPWDWYIVTVANYDDLKSSSYNILILTIVIGSIIFALGCILAYFLANTFVHPISKLKNCMEVASRGNLEVHADIKSKDEIGILADSFNNMISENKRLLDEVVQYDKIKTEFFANISHELKTPLNIIFSTAQLFKLYTENDDMELDKDKLKNYTNTIKQNCYRLLRLVNNLIDLTKIDSGFMEIHLKNENIVEVIENITLSTSSYIESLGRNIIFDTNTEEKIIAIDAEKMERIILNLISNAIKFTKPGDFIEVTICDKGDFLEFSVKDTGIGIPDDKLYKIFERFKQVDSLLNRRHEGSGIGLSLVKSLIEMHGGTISVHSEVDVGTEFIVSIPINTLDTTEGEDSINMPFRSRVEKIQIEFSDIYN